MCVEVQVDKEHFPAWQAAQKLGSKNLAAEAIQISDEQTAKLNTYFLSILLKSQQFSFNYITTSFSLVDLLQSLCLN